MATGTLWRKGIEVATDADNDVVGGALAYFYVAGTTEIDANKISVYSDVALSSALSNPVQADADGRFPEIFLTPTIAYKVHIKTSLGVSLPGYPADNIYAVPLTFNPLTAGNVTFNGTISSTGFGAHAYSAGGTGGNVFGIRNTSAGATNYAGLHIGNDAASSAAQFTITSSSYTPNAQYYQDALTVESARAGGMNVAASNAAGVIRFTAGGTAEIARFSATGGLSIGDTTDPGAGGLRLHVGASNRGLTVVDGTITGVVFASTNLTNSFVFGTTSNHPIAFFTNNTQKAVMTIGGGLLIGVSTCADVVEGIATKASAAGGGLAVKFAGCAHGMTGVVETDTCGLLAGSTAGTLYATGFSEASNALTLAGYNTTAETTRGASIGAAVRIDGKLKSGTGAGSMGAGANLLVVSDNSTSRFFLDADGNSYQDIGTAWTNFDTHDDVALLNLLSAHVTRQDDPLRASFSSWIDQNRDELERVKLVEFNEDGHHFLNMSRLAMLQVGALRQIGARLATIERRQLEA